jgi:hypothetical protein
MAQPISPEMPSEPRPGRGLAPVIVAGGVAVGAVILLAALVLWFRYGTAVFFEMIAAGINACF